MNLAQEGIAIIRNGGMPTKEQLQAINNDDAMVMSARIAMKISEMKDERERLDNARTPT